MKTTTTLGNARPLLLALCLWLLCAGSARSQEFTVSSFRLLPNDASAFVNSVRDLNDEACALVKVEAPSDFAFSTPLGIVKRKDEVGEIWLYLPQGTKMLTLKHPVWGVLRDYQLGTTLESRMTYELKVDVPRLALAERHDTIVQVRTIIDTVTVAQSRPKEPWSAYALATIGAHDNVATAGRLSDIDLTDATIVAGGEPYDDARYAEDDVVGQGLFADCASLSKIVLPSQTTTIEKDAFARCAALELIDIPAAAASVMPSSGCSALQGLRVSEANTHYIGKDGVLLNADATQIVWFPMGKKGSYALPSSVTSVGSYAFKECSIERFVFSDHVAKLGTGVFMNSKVRDVTMPEALRLVPTATFQGCAQLQVVRLGSKTELISDYAFTDCPLTDLYVEARMPPVCQPTAFATLGADVLASCRVHVPKGRANIYKASEGWNLFKNIITD